MMQMNGATNGSMNGASTPGHPAAPSPPSVLSPGGQPGGGPSQWRDYTEFQATVYEPQFREINDRFRYSNLSDPDQRQLVSMLASLGHVQLRDPCNQYTLQVRALHREREAILTMLENHEMPLVRPEVDEDGNLLTEIPNPQYQPTAPLDDEDQEEEVADAEPEFLEELPMDLAAEFMMSRDEMAEDSPGVWYVPLTPGGCYDRLGEISVTLTTMEKERVKDERDGVFYDSGPLLDELALPPSERSQGDVTWMYPFFYNECFRVCAITPQDLHGHIQAVNADTVQPEHGGMYFNPKSLMPSNLTKQ